MCLCQVYTAHRESGPLQSEGATLDGRGGCSATVPLHEGRKIYGALFSPRVSFFYYFIFCVRRNDTGVSLSQQGG